MPDYAEVAGCSSFKNNDLGTSPTYDNYGAYASTTLVGRPQMYQKNVYSAPTSCHYNNNNSFMGLHQKTPQENMVASAKKMNIIENRMADMMNNLNQTSYASSNSLNNHNISNNSSSLNSSSVPPTPSFGTAKRMNGKYNKIGNKMNFGDGRSTDQPLFIKSKYDGTWSSIPNANSTALNNASPYHHSASNLDGQANPNGNGSSLNYLTSFGKTDKV